MSRVTKSFVVIAIAVVLGIGAYAQSLGDAARQNRKQPKPQASKTYTDEDVRSVETPAETTEEKKASDEKKSETTEASSIVKTAEADKNDTDDPARAEQKWKAQFAEQQQKVSRLEKEQQLADREHKLRAAVFYADAGARLRDDKKWAEEERKHKNEMSKLEQDLKTAKEKLDQIREDARKAGVKVE